MTARRLLDRVEDLVRSSRGDDGLELLYVDPEMEMRRAVRRERSLAILRGEAA